MEILGRFKKQGHCQSVSVFGVFLDSIFEQPDWMRRFSPNAGECGPEKLRIRTLLGSDWDVYDIYYRQGYLRESE